MHRMPEKKTRIKTVSMSLSQFFGKFQEYSRTTIAEDKIVYHMSNDCSKRYIHLDTKSPPPTPEPSFTDTPKKESPPVMRKTRASATARSDPSPNAAKYDTICVVCACKSVTHIYQKFLPFESGHAKNFLQAVLLIQDNVYIRILKMAEVFIKPICYFIRIAYDLN